MELSATAKEKPAAGAAGRSMVEVQVLLEISDEIELQFAQLLQAASEFIARLEPNLLVLGMSRDHAFRCAGENDVARF